MKFLLRLHLRVGIVLAIGLTFSPFAALHARPAPHARKGEGASQSFLRQTNTKSNVEFSYTNRGVLFNSGQGQNEGLFWPRGSGGSYIFGEGLWFATKKYLPNFPEAAAGWSSAGSPGNGMLRANAISRHLLVAQNKNLYLRSDTGAKWETVTFPIGITNLMPLPNGNILIGGNTLFVGPDAGPWDSTGVGGGGLIIGISNEGVTAKYATRHFYVPDPTWSKWQPRGYPPTTAIPTIKFSSISSLRNGAMILFQTPTSLWLSRDTGTTWNSLPTPNAGMMAAAFGYDSSIFVATDSGAIYWSSDGGQNWRQRDSGLVGSVIKVFKTANGRDFEVLTDSGIFRLTYNKSNTWVPKTTGISWAHKILYTDIDNGGKLHAADSSGEIWTQWVSPTLRPGIDRLCEIGYNPNSGAGWYIEGEKSQVGLNPGTDGAIPASKYISYVSPRYDPVTGKFIPGSSSLVPAPYYSWPMWDTSSSKTFKHNYYFGDYISDVNMRDPVKLLKNGSPALPAMVSEEDIVNIYSDADPTNNPEFVAGTGYPFGLDIQEVIYSWSYGRYRDMIFVRYKVKNSSNDTLIDSWMAPALDPDLDAAVGGAQNDANSYVNDSLVKALADSSMVSQLREPYRSDPTKLNMGVEWRNYTNPPNGKQYGWLGVSFLESPVVEANGNLIPNDDSATLGGYGPNSLFQEDQRGLVTFRDWIILNDPSTPDLRYDFVSSGAHDNFNGVYQDQRMLMATGPFNLPPGKSVEATIVLTLAHVDDVDYKKNFGALLLLTDFAHQVFGEVDSAAGGYFVDNFKVPAQSSVPKAESSIGLFTHSPYPNPFSTACSMTYRNSQTATVTAFVSDVLGRTVQSFSLGEVSAGEHPLTISGADLPAGTYRVTVTAGSVSQSTNIVLTR